MKKVVLSVVGAFALPVALTLVGVSACSDDDPPANDVPNACATLASRCHPYDKVSTLGHDCHELGHAGIHESCVARVNECLAACPETDAGSDNAIDFDAAVEASANDAATDGDAGDTFCRPWCECLTDTCATQTGYPFTGTPDCESKCSVVTEAERECLPKWCAKAKTLSDKQHVCEHSWGKFGTDECETL